MNGAEASFMKPPVFNQFKVSFHEGNEAIPGKKAMKI